MILKNFLPVAIGFITENKEKIADYAAQLKESGDYCDFNTRLAFDIFYAQQSKARKDSGDFVDLREKIADCCGISAGAILDDHLGTLYKKALRDCGIL